MGVFSEQLREEVRLEWMKPEALEAAKGRRAAIYVPFGAIEWHGYHNVVGLDGLKAHEQLVGLAARVGGVVYPPVYFGAGGGHLNWPSTFMVNREPMVHLVVDLLRGFEMDGYQQCILLSGHYPNRQQYLDAAAAEYVRAGGKIRVLAIVENEAPGVGGDHAAKFETSSMLYLEPETVDLARLGEADPDEAAAGEEVRLWIGEEFRGHPCYGLVGIDPRGRASVEVGRVNTEGLLRALAEWVQAEK